MLITAGYIFSQRSFINRLIDQTQRFNASLLYDFPNSVTIVPSRYVLLWHFNRHLGLHFNALEFVSITTTKCREVTQQVTIKFRYH